MYRTKIASWKILSTLAVIAYMALIFYLSSIPLEFPEIIDRLDPTKFSLHVIEYSVLGFLLLNLNKNFRLSILIGTFYGISDEIHQYFVPFRAMSFFDVLADVIGVMIGIKFYMLLQERIKLKKRLASFLEF